MEIAASAPSATVTVAPDAPAPAAVPPMDLSDIDTSNNKTSNDVVAPEGNTQVGGHKDIAREVVNSEDTDQAVFYACTIFTGATPKLYKLSQAAMAAINGVLVPDAEHIILRALPFSQYNPDTDSQAPTGIVKFIATPFDDVWERNTFGPIRDTTAIMQGGFGKVANIRVPLQRGAPIAYALNYMSRLFGHGKDMMAAAGSTFVMNKISVFFAESGGKFSRMNGEIWGGPVLCVEGMDFGDFGLMAADYIAKKKNDSLFAMYPDGYGFKDVAVFGHGRFTPSDQLLVQHTFWVHANIRAGEFNTGQPWGAVIRKLLGKPCRMVKGGKGAQGKWKATKVSTLSVSASEADFKELVFNVKELVKRGTFTLECDESETNIAFFSSEDDACSFLDAYAYGTSAHSPAITEELAEMKRELKSTLSAVSSQQAKTSEQLEDTAAEVQLLTKTLNEHDAKVTAAQQEAAAAVKAVAEEQTRAADTVNRLGTMLEGFMMHSANIREAHERGITDKGPPSAKIRAAKLQQELEDAAQRWSEAAEHLPAWLNHARTPFFAAAAIFCIDDCARPLYLLTPRAHARPNAQPPVFECLVWASGYGRVDAGWGLRRLLEYVGDKFGRRWLPLVYTPPSELPPPEPPPVLPPPEPPPWVGGGLLGSCADRLDLALGLGETFWTLGGWVEVRVTWSVYVGLISHVTVRSIFMTSLKFHNFSWTVMDRLRNSRFRRDTAQFAGGSGEGGEQRSSERLSGACAVQWVHAATTIGCRCRLGADSLRFAAVGGETVAAGAPGHGDKFLSLGSRLLFADTVGIASGNRAGEYGCGCGSAGGAQTGQNRHLAAAKGCNNGPVGDQHRLALMVSRANEDTAEETQTGCAHGRLSEGPCVENWSGTDACTGRVAASIICSGTRGWGGGRNLVCRIDRAAFVRKLGAAGGGHGTRVWFVLGKAGLAECSRPHGSGRLRSVSGRQRWSSSAHGAQQASDDGGFCSVPEGTFNRLHYCWWWQWTVGAESRERRGARVSCVSACFGFNSWCAHPELAPCEKGFGGCYGACRAHACGSGNGRGCGSCNFASRAAGASSWCRWRRLRIEQANTALCGFVQWHLFCCCGGTEAQAFSITVWIRWNRSSAVQGGLRRGVQRAQGASGRLGGLGGASGAIRSQSGGSRGDARGSSARCGCGGHPLCALVASQDHARSEGSWIQGGSREVLGGELPGDSCVGGGRAQADCARDVRLAAEGCAQAVLAQACGALAVVCGLQVELPSGLPESAFFKVGPSFTTLRGWSASLSGEAFYRGTAERNFDFGYSGTLARAGADGGVANGSMGARLRGGSVGCNRGERLRLRGGGGDGAAASKQAGERQDDIVEEVMWWNARGLAAAAANLASTQHHGSPSRGKLQWLEEHLRAASPSVLCLLEVSGGAEPFRQLRSWFKARGYESKRLAAESRGGLNGAVVAWRRRAVRIKSVVRVAPRTWAFEGSWQESGRRRRLVLIHGLHSAETAEDNGAVGQIDAAEKWLGGRPGLIIGDLNGTLCRRWRSGDTTSQSAMDRRVRDLVGWRCHCSFGKEVCQTQLGVCGRVVGLGWESGGEVRWTRRDERSSARLDYARPPALVYSFIV